VYIYLNHLEILPAVHVTVYNIYIYRPFVLKIDVNWICLIIWSGVWKYDQWMVYSYNSYH